MGAILQSLNRTIIAGIVLLVVILLISGQVTGAWVDLSSHAWWAFFMRWLHVLSGVMWIGLLWYFNFVQTPSMPKIPDEQKPAIGKFIAPEALFWFRWGAMATIVTGLILAMLNGYLIDAITLGATSKVLAHTMIGIGMWLGTIMWFNVWFIIWPAQKKALGMVEADAAAKAAAGRTAMLFSRTNTMLSIPMLFAMVSAQNLFAAS